IKKFSGYFATPADPAQVANNPACHPRYVHTPATHVVAGILNNSREIHRDKNWSPHEIRVDSGS
ncbi:hypothetical protein, partial [Burkholderia sp. SIMBA_019]|uniref:hypothetical protein n=1 Tax=Burkholderia sp. SIMBA_019 TaxID=3085765 RepID=UPI00397C32C3